MPVFDLSKLTAGLSRTWAGYLRDWDRSLRAANHPQTTRYNYLLAAAQLGRYLAEYSPDPDADGRPRTPRDRCTSSTLVARLVRAACWLPGGQGVAGSNPVSPTA